MVKAIVFDHPGDSSVLKLADIQLPELKGNEVLIKHEAIEVSILDIAQRKGFDKLNGNILGSAAVGIVEAKGSEIKNFDVGSKVGYATKISGGAYAEKSVVDSNLCYSIPDGMPFNFAAATIGKGLVAHTLTHRTFITQPNRVILIHAADTALGQMMCQWANYLGALIIGTVSDNKNIEHVQKMGCSKVVNHNDPKWSDEVMSITKGYGVMCAYDPFGKKTFLDTMKCVAKIGAMVSYANLTGPIDPIDPKLIANNSIFLTFPSLFDYKQDKNELLLSVEEVVINLSDKTLRPSLSAELPLAEAAKAHDMIESSDVTGSVVLIP